MLYYLTVAVYVLACLLLLLVVLLQQGKGGDMASAFGGGGGSQTAFGARAGATVLTRATSVLGVLFMLGALILGIMGRGATSSIMQGFGSPGPAAPSTPIEQPKAPEPPKP